MSPMFSMCFGIVREKRTGTSRPSVLVRKQAIPLAASHPFFQMIPCSRKMLLTIGGRVGKERAISNLSPFPTCPREPAPCGDKFIVKPPLQTDIPPRLKEGVHDQIVKAALTPSRPCGSPRATARSPWRFKMPAYGGQPSPALVVRWVGNGGSRVSRCSFHTPCAHRSKLRAWHTIGSIIFHRLHTPQYTIH